MPRGSLGFAITSAEVCCAGVHHILHSLSGPRRPSVATKLLVRGSDTVRISSVVPTGRSLVSGTTLIHPFQIRSRHENGLGSLALRRQQRKSTTSTKPTTSSTPTPTPTSSRAFSRTSSQAPQVSQPPKIPFPSEVCAACDTWYDECQTACEPYNYPIHIVNYGVRLYCDLTCGDLMCG